MIYKNDKDILVIEFGDGRQMVTNIKNDINKPIGIAIWKPNQPIEPVGNVITIENLTTDDVDTKLIMYFKNIEGALVLRDYLNDVIKNFEGGRDNDSSD